MGTEASDISVWELRSRRDLEGLRSLEGPGADGWVSPGWTALLAAPCASARTPRGWIAFEVDDQGDAGFVFGAPPGDDFRAYVSALLDAALEAAAQNGASRVTCHWRGGWTPAEPVLRSRGFQEAAPGIWRRST